MSLGLERVSKALEKLGRPDKSMRCIHVAGSNGKGSVCAHLSSGLTRAGFKVGLFSSRGFGLYLTPREMAKLGQLYVQGGIWNDNRIVSEDWVNQSTINHLD